MQYALLTVNLLCSYSERMCVVAVREGVFEICVGLLEDDNEKVRRHANSLIKVLQGKRLSLWLKDVNFESVDFDELWN